MEPRVQNPVPVAPTARTSFVRFLVAGGASYVVDTGTLVGLHSGLGWSVALATTGAYLVAFFFTFTINRVWVFASTGAGATGQAGRYLVLVGVNYLMTLGIVLGLVELGAEVVVAKTVAAVLIAIANFGAYRFWVFRPVSSASSPPPTQEHS